jgi:hypothetical protein
VGVDECAAAGATAWMPLCFLVSGVFATRAGLGAPASQMRQTPRLLRSPASAVLVTRVAAGSPGVDKAPADAAFNSWSSARGYRYAMPNAGLVCLRRGGHGACQDQPAAFSPRFRPS